MNIHERFFVTKVVIKKNIETAHTFLRVAKLENKRNFER